jgi:hypothetical protein
MAINLPSPHTILAGRPAAQIRIHVASRVLAQGANGPLNVPGIEKFIISIIGILILIAAARFFVHLFTGRTAALFSGILGIFLVVMVVGMYTHVAGLSTEVDNLLLSF